MVSKRLRFLGVIIGGITFKLFDKFVSFNSLKIVFSPFVEFLVYSKLLVMIFSNNETLNCPIYPSTSHENWYKQ